MKFAFLLHIITFTLLVGAPSSLGEVVTAQIEHASILLFVLHYQRLQMRDTTQHSIRQGFLVLVEDVSLDVRFIVIFLGEEEHLRLATCLLPDILISGIDQSKLIGCEVHSLWIEGNEDLSDEFLFHLAQTGRVVSHHWFLELLSAFVHHFAHFTHTHFVHHRSFKPARHGRDQDHIDSLERILLQIDLHLLEDVHALRLHLTKYPFECLLEISLKVEILHYALFLPALLLLLWLCPLAELCDSRCNQWTIMVPVGILPNGPVGQMIVPRAYDHTQEGAELNQPQFCVEYPIPHIRLGRRDKSQVLKALMRPTQIAVSLLSFSVDDNEGHLAPYDGLEYFRLVPKSSDEQCLYVLADRPCGKG